MEPISLENLLRIRPELKFLESTGHPRNHLPTGLVSKNLQGALMMLSNILSWSETEDFMQRTKK